MEDAMLVANGSQIPRRTLEVIAISMAHLGTANEGDTIDIKTTPGKAIMSDKTVAVPLNLMVGWSREAIKDEVYQLIDRLLDAVESK